MSALSRAPGSASRRRRSRAVRRVTTARARARPCTHSCLPSWLTRPGHAISRAVGRALWLVPVLALLVAVSSAAAAPRCFGAAARDPEAPCTNPALRLTVKPRPVDAPLIPEVPCDRQFPLGLVEPCAFGVPEAMAVRHVALIGDSHAAHWRSAFLAVARQQQWRVYAVTRNSCALTQIGKPIPEPLYSRCVTWRGDVLSWLGKQTNIDTVFLAADAPQTRELRPDATAAFQARVTGFVNEWQQGPETVRNVYVIRDNPEVLYNTNSCVSRAKAHRRAPGTACAVARGRALLPDPATLAVDQLASPRFHTIDLTPFFCDPQRCLPVIGGALVYRDTNHMTTAFATSLAPYLLRAVQAFSSS